MNDETSSAVEETGIGKTLGGAVKSLALIGGYVLIGLMLLTVVAVFTRKILNDPIIGVQDISEVSLVFVVFSAMAYAGWTGGHIAVDLIANAISDKVLRFIDTVIRTVSAILMAVLAWESALRAMEAYREGEATNLISIKLYPFFWVIAVGFALFALALFILAWRSATRTSDYPAQ